MRDKSITTSGILIRRKRFRWFTNDWQLYLLLMLPIIYYILFHYAPIYGALIAFKKYSPKKGVMGSPWIGFDNFGKFLSDPYFYKLLRNTLLINFYSLLIAFPASILFALLLNEVKHSRYTKVIQTISYLPHFISTVVVCGLVVNFLRTNDGIINNIIEWVGGDKISFMNDPKYFRTIYIASGIWQHLGWDAIIYIAALTGIDIQLYEAARIEGANRFQQARYVTLPGISATIIVMLILRVGNLMNLGFEKILLLYSGATYETADVISTYVYRRGLLTADFGYGTAIGLFQTVIAMLLLVSANIFGKKFGNTSIW